MGNAVSVGVTEELRRRDIRRLVAAVVAKERSEAQKHGSEHRAACNALAADHERQGLEISRPPNAVSPGKPDAAQISSGESWRADIAVSMGRPAHWKLGALRGIALCVGAEQVRLLPAPTL
jgi:hypothetical protein